jgi:hypothetical protein
MMRRKAVTAAWTFMFSLVMIWVEEGVSTETPQEEVMGEGGVAVTGSVASKISYQGRLTDKDGNPLNGTIGYMHFQLWDAPVGGNQVGDGAVIDNVPVKDGVFSVKLGVPQDAFNGQGLWLQILIEGEVLEPRQELLPVPYALGLKNGGRVYSNNGTPALNISNSGGGYGLSVQSWGNIGVLGVGSSTFLIPPAGMVGVMGVGDGKGVYGSGINVGVEGWSPQGSGVLGHSASSDGVVGETSIAGKSGVYGHSQVGIGVSGRSDGDAGVVAVTTSGNGDQAALVARNVGAGPGIYAEAGSNGYAAIFAGNLRLKSRTSDTVLVELGEGLDYAEGFDVSSKEGITPGSVLVIDSENPGQLTVSNRAYDHKVAGIVSGAKGLGSAVRLAVGKFDRDVALAGRVYCNVDATYGEVSPGDLLTSSPTPGYAMVAEDHAKAQGAVLGKAMERLPKGQKGQILVLVTLQ